MEKADLEELREKVVCGAVLETAGFAVDLKESTRKAVSRARPRAFAARDCPAMKSR